jgi:hypothetical protein
MLILVPLRKRQGSRPADPTPAEIAAACFEIQAEWTPSERRRRMSRYGSAEEHESPWTPRVVRLATR